MGFRISNIHDYDRFIAIDIGSYRVRAVLYTMRGGKLIRDRGVSVRQHQNSVRAGEIIDMQAVSDTIDKAIHEACLHMTDIPEDIIVAYSPSPCLHDSMVSQYMRADDDTPLTMEELDIMIQKIEKISLERVKKQSKLEHAIIYDDIRLISSTLTHITIDGKDVHNPIGATGKYVRITVLNIFALSSEYNILRSILASLKKKTISLVPIPLVFSRLMEEQVSAYEESIYIDLGNMHVNLIFEKHHEITFFDSFPIGSEMLMEMLHDAYPDSSYTTIESLLQRKNPTQEDAEIRERVVGEYLHYVIDTILSVFIRQEESIKAKNIFISGGIFSSAWIEKLFLSILSGSVGYHVSYMHLKDAPKMKDIPSEYLVTEALAQIGKDLLHTKKDPIIRILRYTLYHYE